MIQMTNAHARVHSSRSDRYVRRRHRRPAGRPWVEWVCLAGIIVVLALAGANFISIMDGFL